MTETMMTPYEVFFENVREAMFSIDGEGRFERVNKAFSRLIGWSAADLRGESWERFLALPSESRRFRAELENDGVVGGFELQLTHRTAGPFWCLVDAVVVRDPVGVVLGYVGLVRPSPRKAQGNRPFELALVGADDGLWEWDIQRGTVSYSPRWKALFGYGAAELKDDIDEWFRRVHPDDLNSLKQGLTRFLQGGETVFQSIHRVRHRSGDWQWVTVRAAGEFGEDGRCRRLGGSLSNFTAQMKMFEKLKAQEARLSQLNSELANDKALLTRFFSGDMLAHVFQNGGSPKAVKSWATVVQLCLNEVETLGTRMDPVKYTQFLNEILTDLMDLVYSHKGSVTKMLGDTLICSFSSVVAGQKEEVQAVRCVKAIKAWLATYNDVRPSFLTAPLSLSIGIASGDVVTASVGSIHRLEITLLGPPVKRAERLQREAQAEGVMIKTDETIPASLWD